MIKKIVAFLLLLGAGIGVLHLTIGLDNFITVQADSDGSPIKRGESNDPTFVVGSMGDEAKDAITVSSSGEMRIPAERLVLLPNGSKKPLLKYFLVAQDSQPVPGVDDQIELSEVLVTFYDIDDADPNDPRHFAAATLEARTARMQLGKDEEGRPSVREDRDMDLTDVVVKTVEGSELEPIEMRVPRVLVRQTDVGITLRTPDDVTPFDVILGGDDPMRLDGKGLLAVLPSDDLPEDAPRTLELHVASDPVLVRGESTLSADGSLDYVEDALTGIGRVTLRDNVRADGLLEQGENESPIVVTGDLIDGTLARREKNEETQQDGSAAWISLTLTGAPALLTSDEAELSCQRLDAMPSIDGQPTVFTASGEPKLTQRGDRPGTFHADRIHLVRVPAFFDSLHRPFGMRANFGPVAQDLLIFEGAAHADVPSQKMVVEASRGIRMLRSSERDGPSITVGTGDVRVVREDLTATGNLGFHLVDDGDAGQRLRLGPDAVDVAHEFSISRGGDKPLDIAGHGRCDVTQRADGTTLVELDSPDQDLTATYEDTLLTGMRSIVATTDADGELQQLDGYGDACTFERDTDEGKLLGSGTEIHAIGMADVRMVGNPAVVRRAEDGSILEGAEVRALQFTREKYAVIVTRRRDAQAHVFVEPDGDRITDAIDVDADEIRVVPFLVPDVVLRFHAGFGRLRTWDTAVGATLRGEQVFASGEVDLEQRGERNATARGDWFWTSIDGSAGLLLGTPARTTHDSEDGRSIIATANAIRLQGTKDEADDRVLLMPRDGVDPVIVMHSKSGEASAGVRHARVTSKGAIDAGRELIDFEGPVTIVELDEYGEPLEGGMQVTSNDMQLVADDSGAIRDLVARDDVVMNVRGAIVRGDEMTVDIVHSRATVRCLRGYAEVTLPNGRVVRGRRLDVDYENMLVTGGWDVRL